MMATTIVRLCDIHMAKGDETVNGTEIKIGLDGKWRSIDLCPECEGDMLARLREIWHSLGAPVREDVRPHRAGAMSRSQAAHQANSLEALLSRAENGERRGMAPAGERNNQCLWCPLDYVTLQALTKHLNTKHGIEDHTPFLVAGPCPICGKSAGQLGGHTRSHGFTVSEAYRAAAAEGDPHGIVARTLALAPVVEGGIVIGD